MNGMVPLKKRLQGPPFSQSVVLSLSHIRLFVTQAHQASLSFIISWTLLKLMSIESMMPSNHVIICHPLIFLPSIFPNIRVFSNESVLCIRWPKYWSISKTKNNAVKVLHSICQQIWKTQKWPQAWKRSVFTPIPKKGNAKKCSNYCTVAFM